MDAYGTIAPVDLVQMDTVFKKLCNDRSVSVQGTHWGALINAHGCVNKDLDRAIEIFESISTHPTTVKTKALLPDAVTYESLINVFVTLRRADLIPKYIDRLRSSGIHMTAYIANLLIKGYAVTGDLEKARNVFESLVDPPKGVAATHNHTPHDSDRASRVDPNAPIYREVCYCCPTS
jgi:pentatricopeptide repeat protein